MEIKTYYNKFDLNEGDYIAASFDNEWETYSFEGIVFLSLGIVLDEEGNFAQIMDMVDCSKKLTRKATDEEIKKAISAIKWDKKDGIYTFSECEKISDDFIKNSNEDDILLIKYGAFNSKEELMKQIDTYVVFL